MTVPEIDFNRLNGPQREILRETLISVFRREKKLDIFLQDKAFEPLRDIVASGPFKEMVFDLIGELSSEGKLDDFMRGTREEYPEAPALEDLDMRLGFASDEAESQRVVGKGRLEKMVRGAGFSDLNLWTDRLAEAGRRVCRISYQVPGGVVRGTGFLVGSDLVLTNYHVVEGLLEGGADADRVRLSFGYAETAVGLSGGDTYSLAQDWIVAHAPYGDADLAVDAGEPAAGELDFALLRLDQAAGDAEGPAGKRGWFDLEDAAEDAAQPARGDAIVFVLQHPEGKPLKQSIGILQQSVTPLRLRYDADTDQGSSGGLVLDQGLRPLALHHAGDPSSKIKAEYNQGIPLALIRAALAAAAGPPRVRRTSGQPAGAAKRAVAPEAVAGKIDAEVRQGEAPQVQGVSRLFGAPDTRSVHFVGRERELAELQKLLRQESSGRVAVSIEGLPGIGKTELALQLVYRFASQGAFPGGIFWFDAENPDLTATWDTPIADALGIPAGPPSLERSSQAVSDVSRRNVPALIVLDNVESWNVDKPKPLPEGAHLRYLATTRHRNLGGTHFEHFELDFLEPEPASKLLASVSGRDLAAEPGYEALCKHLGGHAMAVALVGAFLSEYLEATPESYLAQLQGGKVEEEFDEAERSIRTTVDQAFKKIWERLEEKTRRAWRLAACFEPELVSLELSEEVGLTADNRRLLRNLHLIDTDLKGRRWRMHPLTREFGRRAGTEQELTATRVAFVTGCVRFIEQIDLDTGFRSYLPNRSHLDSALKEAPRILGENGPRWSSLRDRISKAMQSAGDLPAARQLIEQPFGPAEENRGEDRPEVEIRRSILDWVLRDLGDLKAERDRLKQELKSDLESFGEDHLSVAIHRSNLALVLKALGELPAARELLEQALESGLVDLGENHPSVATRRSNLALLLQDQGDLPAARGLLEQALKSDLENFGEDHPSVAIRRSILALVLQDQGDLPAARQLLEQALESDLKNFGEDHRSVATNRSNLAVVLQAQGDLQAARHLLEKALESDLRSLPEEHPLVAISRFNLAGICESVDDLGAARDLFEQALATAKVVFGEDHPSCAYTRVRLARALHALGDSDRARAEAQKAVEDISDQLEGSYFRAQVERVAQGILSRFT